MWFLSDSREKKTSLNRLLMFKTGCVTSAVAVATGQSLTCWNGGKALITCHVVPSTCTSLSECFVVTVKRQTASWLHVSFKEGSGSTVALRGLRSSALQTAGLNAPPCLPRHFFLAAVYETEHQFLMEKTFLCVWVCVWGVCVSPCVCLCVCVWGVCVLCGGWLGLGGWRENASHDSWVDISSVLGKHQADEWRPKTVKMKKKQRHLSVNKWSKTPNMVLKTNAGLK